jgi:hypothetical protein
MVYSRDGRDGTMDTKNDKIWFDIDKIRFDIDKIQFDMKIKNLKKVPI